MERNTVSEGLMIRYDVRNGRYKTANNSRGGRDPVMGTYTPRILRGTEFYIGPSTPMTVNYISNVNRDGIYDELGSTTRRRHSLSDRSDVPTEHVGVRSQVAAQEVKKTFQGSELYQIMRPLFWTMTAFGLFHSPCRQTCNGGYVVSKIYGLFVSVLLWLNVIRLLSCFAIGDEAYPGFILKLAILGWYLMGAVSSSVCLIVWMGGILPKFFKYWQSLHQGVEYSFRHKTYIERAVVVSIVLGSMAILCHISFDMYATFGDDTLFFVDGKDLNICPVCIKPTENNNNNNNSNNNYNNISNNINISNHDSKFSDNNNNNNSNTVLRILYVVVFIFNTAAWILPWIQFLIVSLVLQKEFQDFSRRFEDAMTVDKKIHRSLEEYRQRHLAVIKLTAIADRAFCIYVSCVIIIHSLTSLILLSDLLLNYSSPMTRTMHAMWLSTAILFLLVTLGSCLLVDVKARAPLETLIDYRVMSASSENCLQMMLFLKQLKLGFTGFTLLWLFTLTKKTVLIVLCVFAVYLAVLLHLRENAVVPESAKLSYNSTDI